MLINILLVVFVVAAVAMVALILLQQGRGADMGAAFGGGGGSQSLFGSRGSANFLSRTTAVMAAIFFFTSLSLAWVYMQRAAPTSVTDSAVGESSISEPKSQPDEAIPADSEIPEVPVESSASDANDIPEAPK